MFQFGVSPPRHGGEGEGGGGLGDGGGGLGDGGGGLGDGGGGEGEGGGGEGEGGGEGGSGGFAKNVIMGIFPKCLNPMILRPREQIQLLPLFFCQISGPW